MTSLGIHYKVYLYKSNVVFFINQKREEKRKKKEKINK